MSVQFYGAITALQFDVSSKQVFKEIVEDLDTTFQPYGLNHCCLNWYSDNVAIIERDSLRILLGWLPAESEDEPCVMVFSVGHTTEGGNLLVPRDTCEFVRDVLVGHLESYLNFEIVFQSDATQPVDTELVRTVAEILDRSYAGTFQDDPQQISQPQQRQTRALTRDILLEAKLKQANTPPFQELNVIGDESWHDEIIEDDEISLPQRLTIYALGATMLIYTPPVGAALLTYTTLRDFAPSQQPDRLAA
ncbi:hypothetical protein [Roseovarius sp. 2305UL8-3]|uniref:hypothetical protein n=1 Tax=Roseovarius conchicola TaxID=3121636 RepID=UPI003528B778